MLSIKNHTLVANLKHLYKRFENWRDAAENGDFGPFFKTIVILGNILFFILFIALAHLIVPIFFWLVYVVAFPVFIVSVVIVIIALILTPWFLPAKNMAEKVNNVVGGTLGIILAAVAWVIIFPLSLWLIYCFFGGGAFGGLLNEIFQP